MCHETDMNQSCHKYKNAALGGAIGHGADVKKSCHRCMNEALGGAIGHGADVNKSCHTDTRVESYHTDE